MKIEPNFDQRIKLSEFSLNWRWDEYHNPNLTVEELSRIIPFSKEESKRLNKVIDYFEGEHNLILNYDSSDWFRINSESELTIMNFKKEITKYLDPYNENLIISWDRSTTLYTSKELFIKYWDDFLYPSSDDVTIISELTNWVLFYNRIEVGKIWLKK